MFRVFISRTPLLHLLLVACAILATIGAAASGLILSSTFSPAIVALLPVSFIVLGLFFKKPKWALFTALFIVFLPLGLIPANLQSLLSRVLTIVALGTWGFNLLATRKSITWSASHWFFSAFLIWSLASLVWTDNLGISLTNIQTYALRFILFYLVLINLIRSKVDLDHFMAVLAMIGWVLLVTSVATMLMTGYLPGTRLQVAGENSNGLGISALISLPGVLWTVIGPTKSRRGLHIILAIAYLALTVIVVAASGSRGSAISLAVTFAALLLFRQTRLWALACFSILVIAVIMMPSLFTTTLVRFLGSAGDTVLGGREMIWQAGLQLIRDHLFLGVGIGNSSYSVIPYMRMFAGTAELKSVALHNPVLAILAEVGLPGIFFYLGILLSAVGSAMMAFRKQRSAQAPYLLPYYSLVSAVSLGFITSWIKGGGMESAHSLFMMAAMLLIPASLDLSTFSGTPQAEELETLG